MISLEILKINDPYNYDNKNNIAEKDVNSTGDNYIKHRCFFIVDGEKKITKIKTFKRNPSQFLSLENFRTLLKFGPKNFGQLNFRTQFCPKIKTSKIFCS